MATMRAARFYGAGDIRVEDIEVPKATEDKALVQVEWCGICGSDISEYLRGPKTIPSRSPHPISGETLPVTMGHEFVGRIMEAPPGSNLEQGQLVAVDPRLNCGSCMICHADTTNGCESWGFLGLSGGGGGLASMVAVRVNQLHLLPPSVDLSIAVLLEPLAVAWHAVRLSDIKHKVINTPVLIIGGGPIGVATIYVLRAWGVKTIFATEPEPSRLENLKSIADGVFNPNETNVKAECRERTQGRGVGVVFDCAGSPKAMEVAMASIQFHGTYINVALSAQPLTMPAGLMMVKELTFRSSFAYDDRDFKETVQSFKEGHFKGVEKMITSRISLEDVVQKGFEELVTNRDKHMKIIVSPKK